MLNFGLEVPAIFFRKNREFRRVLALFRMNARYICIFAIILCSLARSKVSPFSVISCFFFLEFINYSDRLTKLKTFLLETLKIKG